MGDKAITSLHNQRVKDAAKLRDHRQRARQGRFLIDGSREIGLAITARVAIVEAFVCEPMCTSAESRQVLDRLAEARAQVWHVTAEVFEKMAFGKRHEGVLAVGQTPRTVLSEMQVPDGALVAVIAGLEKPGNVGAILRSADGAGLAAVIAADPHTDPYNPNCIRASLGCVFTVRVCQATAGETLTWLRERGYRMFAARPDARQSYLQVDYRSCAAIILGSEASGLSEAWQVPDVTAIGLPMHGAADSLNVSATAAVLFYEAQRQRATGSAA